MSSSEVYVITVYRDMSKDGEDFEFESLDKVRDIVDDCFQKGFGYIIEKRVSIQLAYYKPLDFKKK